MSNVHVVPIDREHANEGFQCWCNPRVEMICSECEDGDDKASCWRCGGKGWVACDDPEHYDGAIGLLIVHNESAP